MFANGAMGVKCFPPCKDFLPMVLACELHRCNYGATKEVQRFYPL